MSKNMIICRCWDVSTEDIKDVVESGMQDIEWIKRHTGLATGSCQGRCCQELALSWLRDHYPNYEWEFLPTARQPLYPVKVWQLAGAALEDDTK